MSTLTSKMHTQILRHAHTKLEASVAHEHAFTTVETIGHRWSLECRSAEILDVAVVRHIRLGYNNGKECKGFWLKWHRLVQV